MFLPFIMTTFDIFCFLIRPILSLISNYSFRLSLSIGDVPIGTILLKTEGLNHFGRNRMVPNGMLPFHFISKSGKMIRQYLLKNFRRSF